MHVVLVCPRYFLRILHREDVTTLALLCLSFISQYQTKNLIRHNLSSAMDPINQPFQNQQKYLQQEKESKRSAYFTQMHLHDFQLNQNSRSDVEKKFLKYLHRYNSNNVSENTAEISADS